MSAFLGWWAARLRELVPAPLRARSRITRPHLVAIFDAADPPSLTLFRQKRSQRSMVGHYRLHAADLRTAASRLPRQLSRAAVLECPPGLLLERDVDLPEAAEHDLHRVLGHDMDRLTPFRADEILWSGSLCTRDPARRRIVVRLAFLPSASVQPIISALLDAKITVTRIVSQQADGRMRTIDLSPDRPDRSDRSVLERCVDAVALGCCGLLAVAAATLPFVLQAHSRAEVELQIQRLRPRAAAAGDLRREVTGRIGATNVITDARRRLGAPIDYLAFLSEALPDDTYLTALSMRQRTLMISGRSAQSAALVPSLSSNPILHDPALTGVILRSETSRTELFSLSAKVGG